MEATTLAAKLGLTLAIAVINVTATATSLAGVPRIDILNGDATTSRLVGEELLELEEVPLMELSPHLLSELAPVPNAFEVFEDNGAAGFEGTDDLLADLVVAVATEPLFLAPDLGKVPSCRTCTTTLEVAPQLDVTITDVSDPAATIELVGGGDGDLLDATINADYDAIALDFLNVLLEDDVEIHFVASDHEISTGMFPVEILAEVFRDEEIDLDPAAQRQERHRVLGKVQGVGSGIVADRTRPTLGAGRLATCFQSSLRRFDGFESLADRTDGELAGKTELVTDVVVGGVVERDASADLVVPSIPTAVVERLGIGVNAALEGLRSYLEPNLGCSLQTHITLDELGVRLIRSGFQILVNREAGIPPLP